MRICKDGILFRTRTSPAGFIVEMAHHQRSREDVAWLPIALTDNERACLAAQLITGSGHVICRPIKGGEYRGFVESHEPEQD